MKQPLRCNSKLAGKQRRDLAATTEHREVAPEPADASRSVVLQAPCATLFSDCSCCFPNSRMAWIPIRRPEKRSKTRPGRAAEPGC